MGAKTNVIFNRFNYGIVSKMAFARRDIAKLALAAEEQTNIIGRALGAAKFRTGMQYLLNIFNNSKVRCIPFVYSVDDTAILEFSNNILRPLVNEQPILIPATSTAITNPAFVTDLTGWTARDDAGALSYHAAGFMLLRSVGDTAVARRYQQVSVAVADRNKRHCIRVALQRGEVQINIGNTLNDGAYISQTVLASSATQSASYHYFTFTPTGDFFIEFSSVQKYADAIVDSVEIVSNNTIELTTEYTEADLPFIRSSQVNDVIYLACKNKPPKKISRYNAFSWGIEDFAPRDGVFGLINTSDIALVPSALNGQVVIASNVNYFTPAMVNSLVKITSNGQLVQNTVSGNNQYSDWVRVSGVSSARRINITISGTWTGTLALQLAIGEPTAFTDTGTSYTANGNYTLQDAADNSIYYYRIGFSAGYSSGSASIQMATGSGSITGIARILEYTSPTSVIASVLKPFGGLTLSLNWYAGIWKQNNYPSAVATHEGRLWWGGKDRIIGSASDALESYDEDIEGDSAPINVIIGSNGNDTINWLLPLFRLVIGGEIAERTARSTSLDEPLTPTNFSLKKDSTRGSSPVEAVEVDQSGFFVRNNRLFNLAPSDRVDTSYLAKDVTLIAPEVGSNGIVRLAVQRYPDTRIHALRNDGKVALFVFDELEEVQCWQIIETDGFIEDVFVLPAENNTDEDRIYYVVRRVINSVTVRHLCKFAFENECVGGTLNKQADSFIVWNGSSNVITGLSHLEGKQVVVWADGNDLSAGYGNNQVRYTVAGGQITLNTTVSQAIVGLPYTGRYKSSKLAFVARYNQPLTFVKRISQLGVMLLNSHNRALRYGQSYDEMDELPLKYNETLINPNTVWNEFDENLLEFDGDWNNDSRLCLEMQAPRPCTVIGVVIGLETNDTI
jgi:hypothetical protein